VLIRDTARTLAHLSWVERRLFEVVGGWVVGTGDGEVAALLAARSMHHGWRASTLAAQVPLLHDLDASELEAPSTLVALLDAVAASGDDLERLVALAQVVGPPLIDRHQVLLAGATEVADAPVARALRLVLVDEQEDQRAAEVLLSSRLQGDDDVERAAAHRSALLRLLPPGS
jgi:hypothetical protein